MFDSYVYFRLGLNRKFILIALWALPFLAAFIVAYYSEHKLLRSILLIPILALSGSIAHYINGELGGVVDLTGFYGAFIVLKIYLLMGGILILFGTALGILVSRKI